MFGKNPVASPRLAKDGFWVNSIFYTIQGEGPWSGMPTIFVRFAGCNLRCFYCDTDFAEGKEMSLNELLADIMVLSRTHSCKHIVLTGGEPLLQPLGLLTSDARVLRDGLSFQIETAGSYWHPTMDRLGAVQYAPTLIVCSPKTPYVTPKIIPHVHAWKYIIREGTLDPDDGLPNMSTQLPGRPARIYRGKGNIYVQPCDEGDDEEATSANRDAAVAVALKFGYRISLQTHKILGVD